MDKHIFGATGQTVSRLGVGLAEIGFELSSQESAQAAKVLNLALDAGINFLDTAACYDISEELIGQTVAHRRDEYFLASKAGHITGGYSGQAWTYDTVAHSIDRSLKRLRTDRLDLIQLHSCGIDVLEQGDVIRAIEDAQQAGKVLHIGYSGDNQDAEWAVDSGRFAALQTSFNIVEQRAYSTGLLRKAKEQGMGIIAKRPIAGSAWRVARGGGSEPIRSYDDTYSNRAKQMTAVGSITGENPDAIAFSLAFLFAHPEIDVAIVGTKSERHMRSNLELVESGLEIVPSAVAELHRRFTDHDRDWRQLT